MLAIAAEKLVNLLLFEANSVISWLTAATAG